MSSSSDTLSESLDKVINIYTTKQLIIEQVLPSIQVILSQKQAIYAGLLTTADAQVNSSINLFSQQETERINKFRTAKLKTEQRDASYDPLIMGAIENLSRIKGIVDKVNAIVKQVAFIEEHPDGVPFKLFEDRIVRAVRNIHAASNRRQLQVFLLKVLSSFLKKPLGLFQKFMHVAILGDPGSGKTHYANLICALFSALYVVVDVDDNSGKVKELTASDFIAQYAGQTGPKTISVLTNGLEKVVFIDEAYALTDGGGGKSDEGGGASYGKEAVTEMVNFLSTHIGQLIVIVAGYKKEMQDFLVSNPGLQRRFPNNLMLEALTPDQAVNVLETTFENMQTASSSAGMIVRYTIDESGRKLLQNIYATAMEHYKSYMSSENQIGATFDRTKYLATTLFGNGAGSMVNLAAFFQEYIDIVDQTRDDAPGNSATKRYRGEERTTRKPKVNNVVIEKSMGPQEIACVLSYALTFGTSQQKKEWTLIQPLLKDVDASICMIRFINEDANVEVVTKSKRSDKLLAESYLSDSLGSTITASSPGFSPSISNARSSPSPPQAERQNQATTSFYTVNASERSINANVNAEMAESSDEVQSPQQISQQPMGTQGGGKPLRFIVHPFDLVHESLKKLDGGERVVVKGKTCTLTVNCKGKPIKLEIKREDGMNAIQLRHIVKRLKQYLRRNKHQHAAAMLLREVQVIGSHVNLRIAQVTTKCLA